MNHFITIALMFRHVVLLGVLAAASVSAQPVTIGLHGSVGPGYHEGEVGLALRAGAYAVGWSRVILTASLAEVWVSGSERYRFDPLVDTAEFGCLDTEQSQYVPDVLCYTFGLRLLPSAELGMALPLTGRHALSVGVGTRFDGPVRPYGTVGYYPRGPEQRAAHVRLNVAPGFFQLLAGFAFPL
jgi:hypothetical protein